MTWSKRPETMKATAMRLLHSSAISGVPPALTSAAPRQKSPSRLIAKSTRGAIRTFEVTALISDAITNHRRTLSASGPKRCCTTTPAASGSPAIVGSGTTRRNPMFKSR